MATCRTLELVPRRRNFFRFSPAIFDYEFRREEGEILLAFSAKKDISKDLRLRLYETRGRLNLAQRRGAVADEVAARGLGAGFIKSGALVTVDVKTSVEKIAARRGFSSVETILDHFHNRTFKFFRGSNPMEPGDTIFVPQLREMAAIPLGPTFTVEDVAESVPDGGHRHQARWNISEHGYDPLDPAAWIPDALMHFGPSHDPPSDVFDSEHNSPWFPQFAVMTADGELLDVSPSPPELVQETEYELAADDPHAFALVLGGVSRFLSADSTTVTFQKSEQPVAAYGAFDPNQADDEPSGEA